MKSSQKIIPGSVHKSNNYGLFRIKEYVNSRNVIVEFIDTGYVTTCQAGNVLNGLVKDMLKPTVYGVGFIGGSEFKAKEKGKNTKAYDTWSNMIFRCYSEKSFIDHPTYRDCTVCDEWHNFQNFAKWFYDNYIEGCHLDKDIKIKGNRIYSPDACLFVSIKENNIEAKAKNFSFFSPDGEPVDVYNLTEFCKKNSLHQGAMSRVFHGKQSYHKGWTRA